MTSTVQNATLALQVLAGHDPRDPGSDYRVHLRDGVNGLRVGYCSAFNRDSEVNAE